MDWNRRLPFDDDLYVADFLASFTLQRQQAGYRIRSTDAFTNISQTSNTTTEDLQSSLDVADVDPSASAQDTEPTVHLLGEEVTYFCNAVILKGYHKTIYILRSQRNKLTYSCISVRIPGQERDEHSMHCPLLSSSYQHCC
jgi:hypothetical protein